MLVTPSDPAGRESHSRPVADTSPPPPQSPPPSPWRDPWAWTSVLAVVPLILFCLGVPLGEPVSDDFAYFWRALFGGGSFFDGYGSSLYWRPLGRQVYFGLLGPTLLAWPVLVPILHGAGLGAIGLILYRAFRIRWSGPVAAAMATFILLMESARMLLAIATYGEDLGALVCTAIAIHEAAHGRRVTTLVALLGSLLSKEVGVATAILLPWIPAPPGGRSPRARLAWSGAAAGLVVIWGFVYLAACHAHGMSLPHEVEPGGLATSWLARYAWSCANSARTMFSLAPVSTPRDAVVLIPLATVIAVAAGCLVVLRSARARLRTALPWIAWGVAWFLLAVAPLTAVYPTWSPNRAILAGMGFGVAITMAVGAAHPALVIGLVAVRLLAFVSSPPAPATVTVEPARTGSTDFAFLARMQRHVYDTRTRLQSSFPVLPHGARIGLLRTPHSMEYAFGGDLGLQVWYRDTSLHLVRYGEIARHPEWELPAILAFEEDATPQVRLVDPRAMRHYLAAGMLVQREAWWAAHAELNQADSLQNDREARDFLGRVAGRRALSWLGLGRTTEAEQEARRGLALSAAGSDARYALASVMAFSGRPSQARAQLDTLLALYPGDRSAQALRDSLRSWGLE